MLEPDVQQTTALLGQLAQGDAQARERLYLAVCDELRRVAGGLMKGQADSHTLQPTALVHEAWIRLIHGAQRNYENRGHFLGVAAKAMRTVLVDHVRAKQARKRDGAIAPHGLDQAVAQLGVGGADLLDLDQALGELERDDEQLARVVELRFFGGLSHEEIAAGFEVSLSTVHRMWRLARARLHRRLRGTELASDEVE